MSGYCVPCGLSNTLEEDPTQGIRVCTVCGTVADDGGVGLVVLGRVLDGEDEAGRAYLHDGGAGTVPFNAVKGRNGAGTEMYHAVRRAASERYIRSVLAHFGYAALFARTKQVFLDAKRIGGFRWGEKARIIAVACCYVVSREREKGLRLLELSAISEIEYSTLARAQTMVKTWLGIQTTELDPVVFLEGHIVHFSELFDSPASPPLSGSKRSTWTKSNLDWVRSLKLPDVRTLATSLLAFCADAQLNVGRAPEQVSCAVVLVAMEGIARRPAPIATEFLDEMAHRLNVATWTVAERYRELMKVLADFAPRIPWLGEAVKGKKKREMVSHTEDIVRFRKTLDAKEERAVGETKGKATLVLLDDEAEFTDEASENDEDDMGFDDEEGEADEPGGPAAFFPDPLTRPKAAAKVAAQALARANVVKPSKLATALLSRKVPGVGKRPAEYMRQRPGPAKRVRTLEQAAADLLSPFAAPPSVSSSSSTLVHPTIASDPLTARRKRPPATTSLAAHDDETVRFRQLLLAGHDPASIFDGKVKELPAPSTRLARLLWTKTVDEIDDDELFEPGELDGLVRTPEEVAIVTQTGRYREVPDAEPYVEPKPKRKRIKRAGAAGWEDQYEYERASKVDQATKDRLARLFGEAGDEVFREDEEDEEFDIGLAAMGGCIVGEEADYASDDREG